MRMRSKSTRSKTVKDTQTIIKLAKLGMSAYDIAKKTDQHINFVKLIIKRNPQEVKNENI